MIGRPPTSRLRIEPGKRLGAIPVSSATGRPLSERVMDTPAGAAAVGRRNAEDHEDVQILTLTVEDDGSIAIA